MSRGTVARVGEFGLIRMIARWLAGQPRVAGLIRGIGDDCATLVVPSGRTLLKTDAFVEGVHFRRDWSSPRGIGWKALCANVSDIAAASGRPLAGLISLELPAATPVAWVRSLYGGMLACARRYGFAIAGGNISAGAHLAIHVSMTGEAPRRLIGRFGAKPGDLVAVTGALGGSKAGLLCLQRGIRGPAATMAVHRHYRPEPNVAAGRALARYASAMCDISDGLMADAGHIAEESCVNITIVPGAAPVHPAAAAVASRLRAKPTDLALSSGEECELVATIPRRHWARAQAAARRAGAVLAAVGEVRRGRGITVVGGRLSAGFDHFG